LPKGLFINYGWPSSFLSDWRQGRLLAMILTPDKTANIRLVNKNLVDPLLSPLTSRWSWYSVAIKILGNFLKPFALSALLPSPTG